MEIDDSPAAVVFQGSRHLCLEFGLVLEARGVEHGVHERGDIWVITVAPGAVHRAYEELSRYSAERAAPRTMAVPVDTYPGAAIGSMLYAWVLVLAAYAAGADLFGLNWLSAGALDAGTHHEWWRAVTALTLHLDQEHLLGNLLFGAIAGAAAGRLLGPGIAWASILAAAAVANAVEMLIAPPTHRAVGASTAVFAALGLLTGLAWRQRLSLRERHWYRWAPLIVGISLLTLFGSGAGHVDVLGHGLGFICGVIAGWLHARASDPGNRGKSVQWTAGTLALLAVCVAWLLAWRHAS